MLAKDRAVCIRTVDYSETSQVVVLFGRLSGKIRALAKGSKRPKSPFDGPIEGLSFGDIVFSGVRKESLATLTEFQPKPVRGELRRSLYALQCAQFAAELVDALTDEYDPHPDLFDQFVQFLEDAEEGRLELNRRDILIRLILFQLVLLHEVGLQPVLNRCVNCKTAFSEAWHQSYFSHSANGLICRDCEMSFPDRILLGSKAVKHLTDVRGIANADAQTLDENERILIRHLTAILGHRLRLAEYVQGAHDINRGDGAAERG